MVGIGIRHIRFHIRAEICICTALGPIVVIKFHVFSLVLRRGRSLGPVLFASPRHRLPLCCLKMRGSRRDILYCVHNYHRCKVKLRCLIHITARNSLNSVPVFTSPQATVYFHTVVVCIVLVITGKVCRHGEARTPYPLMTSPMSTGRLKIYIIIFIGYNTAMVSRGPVLAHLRQYWLEGFIDYNNFG